MLTDSTHLLGPLVGALLVLGVASTAAGQESTTPSTLEPREQQPSSQNSTGPWRHVRFGVALEDYYGSGMRVSLPVHDRVTLSYMLTNCIQQTEDFNDFKSNHFTAVVKPTDQVTWTVNYYFGQEQPDGGEPGGPDGFFRVFDTYATYTPTSDVSFGVDVNYVTSEVNTSDPSLSLQGIGAYAPYQVTGPIAIAVRYERLDDEGLFGGIDQVLHETTLTAEYKFADGFLVRGELRSDWSNQQFFTGRPDVPRDRQNTALAGLVWWFGNKHGAW